MLRHAGVCVRAGCTAQGLYSIPGQIQPRKACGLTLPRTRMATGVYQNRTQNKGPKLPPGAISPLYNPPWGATTAGMTTKCQSKPLNNKRHRKKFICVTHVAVYKSPKAPSFAPTLSCSASCLCCCCSPSSVQVTIWSLIKLCLQVGLQPHILPLHPLQWEVGV